MVEDSRLAELDQVFSALADPTRRAILQRLTRHPATVTEIAGPFPVSLNAISKHLRVLEQAGLLRREIKGREHYCRIEPRPLREADRWLQRYRQFWEVRMGALETYVARKYQSSKRRSHGERSGQISGSGATPDAGSARNRV
ncbi:MAG TPA: metalloregulator ArsR/SmtB family transcription factor [Candidatus Sulfotelmatobacter sp.]